jgi:hypothetical protein
LSSLHKGPFHEVRPVHPLHGPSFREPPGGIEAAEGDFRDAIEIARRTDSRGKFARNDDNDGLPNSEGDVVDQLFPNHEHGVIRTERDLEDFARLHLFIDAFHKELADGKCKMGLSLRTWEEHILRSRYPNRPIPKALIRI